MDARCGPVWLGCEHRGTQGRQALAADETGDHKTAGDERVAQMDQRAWKIVYRIELSEHTNEIIGSARNRFSRIDSDADGRSGSRAAKIAGKGGCAAADQKRGFRCVPNE